MQSCAWQRVSVGRGRPGGAVYRKSAASEAESRGGTAARLETIATKRAHIHHRRLAVHHLADQPARGRAEGEALMTVAKRKPEPVIAMGRADDRFHIGQTRACAFPGRGFTACSQ